MTCFKVSDSSVSALSVPAVSIVRTVTLTVNIMMSVEETLKSHIHIVTVLTMLTAGADNADTDKLLTLKQVIAFTH